MATEVATVVGMKAFLWSPDSGHQQLNANKYNEIGAHSHINKTDFRNRDDIQHRIKHITNLKIT